MIVVRVNEGTSVGRRGRARGELWLTADHLIWVGAGVGATLRRSTGRSVAAGAVVGGGLGAAVFSAASTLSRGLQDRPVAADVSEQAWVDHVRAGSDVLVLPLAEVVDVDLDPGAVTTRVRVRMRDGQRHQLQWVRHEAALTWVSTALGDLEAHRAALAVAVLPELDERLAGPVAPDPTPEGDQDRAQRVLAPGCAPTPYTAEEIRAGCPDGRVLTTRVETGGMPPFLTATRFVDGDELGVRMERTRLDVQGAPLGAPDSERLSWAALQAHASFPAVVTTIGDEELETPFGRLACRRYAVRREHSDETYWFALDRPGPPVRVLMRADGRVVGSVQAVADTTG